MQTINALTLRGKLGSILDRVVKGEHYVIERFNKPLVVVVPFTEYKQKILSQENNELKKRGATIAKILEFRQKNAQELSNGKNSVLIIRNMRDEKNS